MKKIIHQIILDSITIKQEAVEKNIDKRINILFNCLLLNSNRI